MEVYIVTIQNLLKFQNSVVHNKNFHMRLKKNLVFLYFQLLIQSLGKLQERK